MNTPLRAIFDLICVEYSRPKDELDKPLSV